MLTTLIFIVVLAVLIFVHELGHFLVARACGIRVDAFKIGFGPKLLAWTRGETEYGINLIPFGGYVKIHGENPDEESISGPDAGRSFVNKSRWKQILVLIAGVTFNFIFAWMLYAGGFISGVTATSDGFEKYADNFTNERIMVTFVAKDSPADKAGLVVGDVIVDVMNPINKSQTDSIIIATSSINKATTECPDCSADSLQIENIQRFINESEGNRLQFAILKKDSRDSKIEPSIVAISPVSGLVDGKYAVGIGMSKVGDLHLPFFTAIGEGFRYTLIMIRETTLSLGTFFINIFKGQANFSDVAGPIGIAGIVGDAAGLGFNYLIMITALISINLGVINLVPFPALDGGRVLFVLIEGVIRRRIPMNFTNWVNGIGFALLMILMLVITYRDIIKLFK